MEPKIRLKGFLGDWEGDIIGNIATFSKGRGYSKSDLRQKGNPIILYGRLYTNYSSIISSVDTFASLQKGSVLSKGNEVIIPGSGETPEDIAIASSVEQEGIILGGDLNIVSFDLEKIVPAFAAMGITYGKTHYELSGYAQGKTVVHLHNSSISKGHLSYPSKEEQEAIVIFISTIDSLIQSTSKKIESLKQVKAASLQSMFPQEGENTPRLRFKGFEGAWNKVTIGECLEEVNEKNSPIQTDFLLSLTIKDGVLPYSEKGNIGNRAKEDHSLYKLAYPDTIVLNSMNILIGAIGMCDYFGCVSPVYYVLRCKPVANRRFMFDIMSNKKFQRELKRIASGMMEIRLKVPMDEFLKKDILIPSFKEQQKIADFFASLDSQLNLQTLRLEKLKQIKSACLDNMFV